jgi:hypothetical protein
MLPKKFKDKGKQMIATIVQHDWGSDLGDETKIKTMRRKGISTSISSSSIQSYKLENFY